MDDSTGISYTPKVRFIVIGFHDPDVLDYESSAPMPNQFTINVFLIAASCLGYEVEQGDFEAAFAQGKPIGRLLYLEAPRDGGFPGLEAGQLLRLDKELYGTIFAPAHWRKSLTDDLKVMNYEESMLDPCLYLLRSRESREKIYKNDQTKNLKKCPYVESEWLMETALGEKGDLPASEEDEGAS